ncbi:BLOC-1-related complex subunit 6 isoform X3 [Dendroctonus ponderosae]|uniref:BLOC-1-related complex subunit 6 C-terminal helix domain-containing protein n=1 Tax=Dendroctonus ponderosae TaxID=77166 RepID=A0AAR5PDK8_DENPD|nr:BLOC-1-related complex subunit 6 isoform X3 [Dendroctonus ponderosae]XP_019759147.1 BLOC-1-related complex subunit 6 isoform X3 [Dendroctonus ponderosae]
MNSVAAVMELEHSRDSSPTPPHTLTSSLPPPLPMRPSKVTPNLQTELLEAGLQTQRIEEPLDLEGDDISQHMTQSYSEISFKSGFSPDVEEHESLVMDLDSVKIDEQFSKRPVTLPSEKRSEKPLRPLNLDGTVHVEGNMTHFVAEDLETKIKLSSPVTKKNDTPTNSRSGTPSTLYRQLLDPQLGQIDVALINDLECEAHRMATSVDNLIENLSGILHSVSSITADNVDIYKNAVSKMSDSMDGNIKSMYKMMAKAEEITKNMKGVEVQAAKIKEVKKLVDLFESFV